MTLHFHVFVLAAMQELTLVTVIYAVLAAPFMSRVLYICIWRSHTLTTCVIVTFPKLRSTV